MRCVTALGRMGQVHQNVLAFVNRQFKPGEASGRRAFGDVPVLVEFRVMALAQKRQVVSDPHLASFVRTDGG